ncbi:hypothetical protein T440DRAFT_302896 [Plenodomus tracheiphilus IPT5]|uniref:FAS1 domain-containing protein n=1 Tax=Plenodomus tracheiphilus IPT5 TaxID=1408161 RepID=A0A6A7ARG3_9PLEO|nr:hypothetical protein T440DRAFT_302896 [Plenodomus tracheiphilus IPT5]
MRAFLTLVLAARPLIATIPHNNPGPLQGFEPVLTTLKNTPDLSRFYELIKSTGGSSGIPGPPFEERFNDPNQGLQYTILAPTNEALQKLPPQVLTRLQTPLSYELLATILRNHIIPGNVNLQDVAQSQRPIGLIGGFSVLFDPDFGIVTNPNLTSTDRSAGTQAHVIKDSTGNPFRLNALNGAVYKIDNILDGFLTFYGADATSSTEPPVTMEIGRTMGNILCADSQLTITCSFYRNYYAGFLRRISLPPSVREQGADPNNITNSVFLVPSNAAWDVLPPGSLEKAAEPHNFGASSLLIGFGLGQYDRADGEVRSTSGFNISVRNGRANNAKILKKIQGSNGQVWVAGRILDPIFDALDTSS